MSEPQGLEITLTAPVELKPYRNAVNVGLFYLALGNAPMGELPTAECKSMRVKVSGEARPYLERLTPRFGSQRQAIINALAWVAAQPPERRALLQETII